MFTTVNDGKVMIVSKVLTTVNDGNIGIVSNVLVFSRKRTYLCLTNMGEHGYV